MSALRLEIVAEVEEVLRAVEEQVRKFAEPIAGEPFSRMGFVDGSYALDERRGAYVLALSAATVVVDGGRLEGVMRGSERPYLTLLAPKGYGESRSSLLMLTLELLSAAELVERGVEAVFLDGSYVSEMLVPFGYVRDVYEQLTSVPSEKLLDAHGEELVKVVESSMGNNSLSAMRNVLEGVQLHALSMHREMKSEVLEVKNRKEALDFATVYAESTAYLAALKALLERCKARGVRLLWVAKDAESRSIVEREGVAGWLNDLTLLDYAWRDLEAVRAVLDGRGFGKPKPCAAWSRLIEELYKRWGGYGIAYFKLRRTGAVIQMTYPNFVERGDVDRALATLLYLSDSRGYPRPLSYVHHMTVLSSELAKLIADELYRRERGALRPMLAPSGRVMVGLR